MSDRIRVLSTIILTVCIISTVFLSLSVIGEYEDSTQDPNQLVVIGPGSRSSRTGETHNVGLGTKYSSIQDAIDISNPGDTVRVYAGAYYENLVIDKPIILIGNGTSNTIIDGGGKGDTLLITADWINIRGFTITNSGTKANEDAGIELNNVQNCDINNNYLISNGQYGILLNSSDENVIAKNYISSNENDGIHLTASNGNTITENSAVSNRAGISTVESSNNLLLNNVLSSNRWCGIYLLGSFNNKINNNKFNNNFDNKGIYIYRSNNTIITNNTMINNGILIEGPLPRHWDSHTIDDSNTVNSKPVHYWTNRDYGTVPEGAGQVILSSCTGVKVQNQIISKVYIGILLGFSNNNIITKNEVTLCYQSGISLQNSHGNYITDNKISNSIVGIDLFGSNDNNIIENTVNNNIDGIFICCQSESNIIDNNNADLNDNGIRITSTLKTSITNNICSYNLNGISIGISAKSTTMVSNTVFSNNDYGIYLNKCESIIIRDNTIYRNHNYGIYLNDAVDPRIYNNNFINNTHHAYDNKPNKWNVSKTKGGNFWSDWKSIDENEDGFFDEQYPIAGPGKAMDNLPLVYSTGIQLRIITKNIQTVYVEELFSLNYSAIYLDDSNSKLTWNMDTDADWLTFSEDRELFGTPEIGDFGTYWINVSVSDGFERDFNNFTLNVLTKISPRITTTNDLIAYVDQSYSIYYTAFDPDTPQDKLIWSMDTNATWLKFSSTQELFGTASYSDLGYYWVSIEVSDGNGNDLINFMIRVWATKEQVDDKNKIPEIKETSIVKNSKNILIDTSDIEISFSKEMNKTSIEENLKIIPDINYSLQWENDNTKLLIIFNEDLEYITTYQISIRKDSVDLQGNNLEETFTLTFTTVTKQTDDRPEGQNWNIQILSYFGVLAIILVIIYFIFMIKNRRIQRERIIKKYVEPEGRIEYQSSRIIDVYPYKDVAICNAEEYMKHLIDEALEFEKPSVFKTSIDEMWRETKIKYQQGSISKNTYNSIKEELGVEDYPYEGVSIGNSEEYMKKLLDEALEFKKPSKFETSEEQMLSDVEEKFNNGKISKFTYESIKETLTKIEKYNLDPEFDRS